MPQLRPDLKDPVYLGDAVYAAYDPMGQIWVFTSNGLEYSNYVCLEYGTLNSLIRYADERGLRR